MNSWSHFTQTNKTNGIKVKHGQQTRLSVKDSDNNWRSVLITCDMSGRDEGSTDIIERASSSNAGE